MRPWANGILFLKRDGAFCVDSPSFSWGQGVRLGQMNYDGMKEACLQRGV
jgi:hypothetical protein